MTNEEFMALQAGDILITDSIFAPHKTAMKGLISSSGVASIRTLGFSTVFPRQVQGVIKHDDPENKWTNGEFKWPAWPAWTRLHGIMPGDQLFKEDK